MHRVPQDRISEQGWIRKEIRLRYVYSPPALPTFGSLRFNTGASTMCMIRSLDCAFLFYSNYPCRLTLSEMSVDMPCDSSVFNSEHPFADDNFSFSRTGNLTSVFEELFDQRPYEFTNSHPGESPHSNIQTTQHTRKTQTVIDLFISIHCMFIYLPLNHDSF